MATLKKLAIRGIRSFDDKDESVIEFSPVTVIVGHNGSGKTTIIECLKYATTGDKPANTQKGGAFVHDPRVANEKKVKAQVKLMFNTGSGKPMLVVRNSSVKLEESGALTFETLESILKNASNNEENGKVRRVVRDSVWG